MQIIQHQELASAQASITFSSIPQTFTDLYLVFSIRQDSSGVNQALIEFNSSSSNFSFRVLEGSGSAASSGSNVFNYAGLVQGSASTSNTFASNSMYIPNYTSSAAKSFSTDAVTENNATAAFQHLVASLWNNTAAINSIAIKPASGNLVQYSSATLYGITKGSDGIVTVS